MPEKDGTDACAVPAALQKDPVHTALTKYYNNLFTLCMEITEGIFCPKIGGNVRFVVGNDRYKSNQAVFAVDYACQNVIIW